MYYIFNRCLNGAVYERSKKSRCKMAETGLHKLRKTTSTSADQKTARRCANYLVKCSGGGNR